jgi:FkbM family methyltransferase
VLREIILKFEDLSPPLLNWLRYFKHVVVSRSVTYPDLLDRIFKEMNSKSLAAVDIGANVGIFTRYLSKNFQLVHSIEPLPHLADRLSRCFGSNVRIHNNAIGATDGEVVLRTPLGANGQPMDALSSVSESNNFDLFGQHGMIETNVKIRTLSSLLRQTLNIGFVKIDVEGFERSVVEGSVEVLKVSAPLLMIEIGKIHDPEYQLTLTMLERLGYQGFVISNEGLKKGVAEAIEAQPSSLSNDSSTWYGQWDFLFIPQLKMAQFQKYMLA